MDVRFTTLNVQPQNLLSVLDGSNFYDSIFFHGPDYMAFDKEGAVLVHVLPYKNTTSVYGPEDHVDKVIRIMLEHHLKELMPHYRMEDGRFHENLLTATYAHLQCQALPTYSFLVTPVLRGYEYYLHRVLHDKMGLETERNKANNFRFFERLPQGEYRCSHRNVELLSDAQEDYLNRLFMAYREDRHPLAHWPLRSKHAVVLTELDLAKEMLERAFLAFNEYYQLF